MREADFFSGEDKSLPEVAAGKFFDTIDLKSLRRRFHGFEVKGSTRGDHNDETTHGTQVAEYRALSSPSRCKLHISIRE